MQTDARLPVYAHWHGQEILVDLPENQPDPDVGSIIHITVELAGERQRRPFKVTAKHQRTEAGLLARFGLGSGGLPTAIDLDVEPHDPTS